MTTTAWIMTIRSDGIKGTESFRVFSPLGFFPELVRSYRHALVRDTRNKDAVFGLPIEHNMFALLYAA
jgi:hypothetical protein